MRDALAIDAPRPACAGATRGAHAFRILADHVDIFADAPASEALEALAPRALLCELHAGEALYIPHPWAHAVLSANEPPSGFGLNCAVNVWALDPHPHLNPKPSSPGPQPDRSPG